MEGMEGHMEDMETKTVHKNDSLRSIALSMFSMVIALVWLFVAGAGAQAPAPLQTALTELDASIAAEFAKDGVGGISVGVVSGSKLVWSKHYGYAEAEKKRAPTNDTEYRIGSITKQFTALALLQLVEDGRMRLTDPLEKYVPEIKAIKNTPAGTPPITLLQVATMHAGLAREPGCAQHSVGPLSVWQQKVIDCLPGTTYVNEPGTTFLYSNIGYASLGLAIERAAGKPFTAFVTDRILKPLGMTRTGWEPSADLRKDLAHGYQRPRDSGAATRAAADRELEGRGYRVPNGALFSTVTDLTKFVAWELGEGPAGILKKETQDANYARVFASSATFSAGYGVGFQVSRRGDLVLIGHGGSTAGYHAAALVHRPTRLGVIVLRNCDSCTPDAGPTAARILQRIAGS
ncbi:MAG TPA: serine hydrolase domain-containing protein [Vicinamibacterales bacterium]|nr:serine hydrolase domain-containing protein [Vicinamibacterales bacterium]